MALTLTKGSAQIHRGVAGGVQGPGCLPEGCTKQLGVSWPSRGRLCVAHLQQLRKCWQETRISLTTPGEEPVSPHRDLGVSAGPTAAPSVKVANESK